MDQDEEADNGGDGVLWITMKRMIMVDQDEEDDNGGSR